MLKVSHLEGDSFHSFKCGEIFYVTAAVLKVSCCLCGNRMHLEQFSGHFQIEHLALAKKSLHCDILANEINYSLAKKSSEINLIPIKVEDTEEGLIKREEEFKCSTNSKLLEENATVERDFEKDTDNKYLQKKIPTCTKSKEETTKSLVKLKEFTQKDVPVKEPLRRHDKNFEEDTLVSPAIVEVLQKAYVDCNETANDEECDEIDDRTWSDIDSNSENDSTDELPFPCHVCKRSYRTKHSLQKHNYSVHNPNKQPAKKHKEPKTKHKCDVCNEVFRSARDLGGHRWKHTGIVCDVCGKSFSQTGNLVRHKIRHTGIKDFKCKECNKEFFTPKELKSHMICHTGVMPIICEICGKRCRDRGVLTAHMRRHTGERPAKCDVCDKTFFSFHDLNVHAVTHTSERPFTCDICGSTFQRKKALRVHKLLHSKDRKHVCKICGKGFAQSGGLNSHMRTHDAAVEKGCKKLNISAKDPPSADPCATLVDQTEDTFIK